MRKSGTPYQHTLAWLVSGVWEVHCCVMEEASASETSVNLQHATRRNNPKDSHLHSRCHDNLNTELQIWCLRTVGFIHASAVDIQNPDLCQYNYSHIKRGALFELWASRPHPVPLPRWLEVILPERSFACRSAVQWVLYCASVCWRSPWLWDEITNPSHYLLGVTRSKSWRCHVFSTFFYCLFLKFLSGCLTGTHLLV
jgi:hypothetical protein